MWDRCLDKLSKCECSYVLGRGQSGKCYRIRKPFFVKYRGIVFLVIIKEISFTVLLSFILIRYKLHCYLGLMCKSKCSSYLKIVLINVQLCSLHEKMTSWGVICWDELSWICSSWSKLFKGVFNLCVMLFGARLISGF